MVEPTWKIRQGDVLERLREMPDESVHCVVTSPPYWGLRDYGLEPLVWDNHNGCEHGFVETRQYQDSPIRSGTEGVGFHDADTTKAQRWRIHGTCSKCGAWRGCLGLEPTPELYVEHVVQIFRELKRVLRNDGTLWLNLGDSYSASGKGPTGWNGIGDQEKRQGFSTCKAKDRSVSRWDGGGNVASGCKPKDLVGIPWMVAFALRADGWYLRSDIIWSKPNPMPESVTDRPTKSHEYVFLLSKSARYYYDAEAIKERSARPGDTGHFGGEKGRNHVTPEHDPNYRNGHEQWGRLHVNDVYRNTRSVWNIATQPFSESHFATFPERLVDRCISAGTSEKGVCGECGKPWERVVEREKTWTRELKEGRNQKDYQQGISSPQSPLTNGHGQCGGIITQTTGWQQQCEHDAPPIPATVLDIFSGSGTSGVVARKLGRNYIGIELNPQYVAMSERRLRGTIYQAGLFSK